MPKYTISTDHTAIGDWANEPLDSRATVLEHIQSEYDYWRKEAASLRSIQGSSDSPGTLLAERLSTAYLNAIMTLKALDKTSLSQSP